VIEFAAPDEPFERDDHVVVSFAGPTPQRRWTVALRFILTIPHFLWASILGYAGGFVAFLAWFAALFTGRVPDGMARFMSRVLQYQTRVYGYGYLLLTDEYPAFALDDDDGAINVTTSPGEFNRAAVFFRLILIVPSAIASAVLLIGAQMVSVVAWLLTLIMGRMPTPLWEANAAVLRYWARAYAFASMLTAEQPKRAFGDLPGGAAALSFDGDVPDLPARPHIVRLVLSKAAKRIMVLFIVVAVVGYGGFLVVISINAFKTLDAYRDLDAAHDTLGVSIRDWSDETQQCAFEGGAPCVRAASLDLAGDFDQFAADVAAIDFPQTTNAGNLIVDARDCATALRKMGAAETPAAYQTAAGEFQDALDRFDEDYETVAVETQYE
jgi:hypothetical protein